MNSYNNNNNPRNFESRRSSGIFIPASPWKSHATRNLISGPRGLEMIYQCISDGDFDVTLDTFLKCFVAEQDECEKENYADTSLVQMGLLACIYELILLRCNRSSKRFRNYGESNDYYYDEEEEDNLIMKGKALISRAVQTFSTRLKKSQRMSRYKFIQFQLEFAAQNPSHVKATDSDTTTESTYSSVRGLYIPALIVAQELYMAQGVYDEDEKINWNKKFYTLFARLLFAMGFKSNSESNEDIEILPASRKEMLLCSSLLRNLTKKSFDTGMVSTISFKLLQNPEKAILSLVLFSSALCSVGNGLLFESHLLNEGLSLISVLRNILRRLSSSSTSEEEEDVQASAIELLVILVKSCSCKALSIISETFVQELTIQGSENVSYRITLYRAFEECAMVATSCTCPPIQQTLHTSIYQQVVDTLTTSLKMETTIEHDEASIGCEAALEAWVALKGDDENYKPKVNSRNKERNEPSENLPRNSIQSQQHNQHFHIIPEEEASCSSVASEEEHQQQIAAAEEAISLATEDEKSGMQQEINSQDLDKLDFSIHPPKWYRRPRVLALIFTIIVISLSATMIILISLHILVLPSSTQEEKNLVLPTTIIPTLSPTFTPTLSNDYIQKRQRIYNITPALYEFLLTENDLSLLNNNHSRNHSHDAFQALQWVLNQDEYSKELNLKDLEQRYILALFYYATNGQYWNYCTNSSSSTLSICNSSSFWLSSSDTCSWYGISCLNIDNSITEINLTMINLHGTLPMELKHLQYLRKLILSSNKLHGSIPFELGLYFGHLTDLNLYKNQFTGTFPSSLYNISSLQSLNLGSNKLTGSLKYGIGNLQNLRGLYLQHNKMTSSLPLDIGNLVHLLHLWIHNNDFQGDFPNLSKMSELEQLDVRNNNFTGNNSLSFLFDNLHSLQTLFLDSNNFHGTLPHFSNASKNLKLFSLSNNYFHGTVSDTIHHLVSLQYLNLVNNSFYGTIPNNSLEKLSNLKSIQIQHNSFWGSVTESVCRNLKELHLFTADCTPIKKRQYLTKARPPSLRASNKEQNNILTSVTLAPFNYTSYLPSLAPSLDVLQANFSTSSNYSNHNLSISNSSLFQTSSSSSSSAPSSKPSELFQIQYLQCSCCTSCCNKEIYSCGEVKYSSDEDF